LVGLPIGFLGVFFLLGPQGHVNPWWMLITLFGTGLWAYGQTYTRHARMPQSYIYGNAIGMLAAGIAFSLASLVTGEPFHANWGHFPMSALLSLAYLVVFGSCVAYSAFTWLVSNASPAQVSTYTYVNPLVAVVLGALILHEPVSGWMGVGTVLILISVGLSQAKGSSPFDRHEPARSPSGCSTRSS
jgi:drug/metabolite transporter (DMT)-like permease